MTNPAPIDAELLLAVSLGSSIAVYRPTTLADGTNVAWKQIDEDTEICVVTGRIYDLRLRVVAQDPFGVPVSDPAWMVTAYTTTSGQNWRPIGDHDTASAHFLTHYERVTETVRRYRFTVGIPNSGIDSTFEVSVRCQPPAAASAGGVVIEDGDFIPPDQDPTGNTPSPSLVAGNLAAPL